jgi:hypothetical protein
MTRSAPRYVPPADRARRAARDPFAVRLAVLFAAGVIVTPIAALVARSNGHEVVQSGQLPGAAVAVEPVNDSSSTVAPPAPVVDQGTVPATVPPSGTLPATIAPPTTAAPATTEAAPAEAAVAPTTAADAAPKSNSAPKPPPTTAAPKPAPTTAPPATQPPHRSWGESEVVQIIRSVFPDDIEEHALFIANRESRFDPYARNFCCTGLFQIYGAVHEQLINSLGFSVDQLTDPLVNCVVALAIYQRSGWAPWGG